MIAWTIYLSFAGALLSLVTPRVLARWVALAHRAACAVGAGSFFCRDIAIAPFTPSRACVGAMLGMSTIRGEESASRVLVTD